MKTKQNSYLHELRKQGKVKVDDQILDQDLSDSSEGESKEFQAYNNFKKKLYTIDSNDKTNQRTLAMHGLFMNADILPEIYIDTQTPKAQKGNYGQYASSNSSRIKFNLENVLDSTALQLLPILNHENRHFLVRNKSPLKRQTKELKDQLVSTSNAREEATNLQRIIDHTKIPLNDGSGDYTTPFNLAYKVGKNAWNIHSIDEMENAIRNREKNLKNLPSLIEKANDISGKNALEEKLKQFKEYPPFASDELFAHSIQYPKAYFYKKDNDNNRLHKMIIDGNMEMFSEIYKNLPKEKQKELEPQIQTLNEYIKHANNILKKAELDDQPIKTLPRSPRDEVRKEEEDKKEEEYEGGWYDYPDMSYSNAYDTTGAQYAFKERGSVKEKDLPKLADLISRYGRNGDTELAHVNPLEAMMLKKMGGSGSINPKTGLREYKGGFFRKPFKAIKSVLGGGAGALLGNLVLPGVGGIIGGAIGQGAQHAARGKSALGGALKGAGMGAALPSVASGLGWGATKLGASGLGSSLSNYGTTNAILPALGLSDKASSGIMGIGKTGGKLAAGNALLNSMGGNQEKGLGMSAGDDSESYLQYLLAKEKEKDNMSFLDKLQSNTSNFLTKPKNLLAVGSTGLTLYDRFNQPKPKTAAQEGKELKEKMLAQRLTPEELAAQEQYELQLEQAKRRNARKKFLPEEKIDIEPIYSRVSTPDEYRTTGRWLNYYNNPQFSGTPIRF